MEGVKSRKITIGLTGLTILLFVSYIYFASTLTSLGYALDKKVEENVRLTELENELTLELARLQNPGEIARAGEVLNMVEVNGLSRYIDARVSVLGIK